jgi:nucleoid-associated protein YgaU
VRTARTGARSLPASAGAPTPSGAHRHPSDSNAEHTPMTDMPDFSNVKGGSSSTATKIYEVKSGDSLSKIAKKEYGDASKWPQIFEANKDIVKDPNKIFPGQKLKIPPLA